MIKFIMTQLISINADLMTKRTISFARNIINVMDELINV